MGVHMFCMKIMRGHLLREERGERLVSPSIVPCWRGGSRTVGAGMPSVHSEVVCIPLTQILSLYLLLILPPPHFVVNTHIACIGGFFGGGGAKFLFGANFS